MAPSIMSMAIYPFLYQRKHDHTASFRKTKRPLTARRKLHLDGPGSLSRYAQDYGLLEPGS